MATRAVTPCPNCHGAQWVCELHPDKVAPHDDCQLAQMPCPVCQKGDARPPLRNWQEKASTARDFSVMPVLVLNDDGTPAERVSLHRPVRGRGDTRPGNYVDVEFGVTWSTRLGQRERVDGQWRQCRIVKVVHSELHVVLDPSPVKAPPDVPFG